MKKNVFVSFDIDGTVIRCVGSYFDHLNAFSSAISELFAPCTNPPDFLGHPIDGMMDKAIIAEMLDKLGVEKTEENFQKIFTRMEEIFIATAHNAFQVPEGMENVLRTLSEMPNVEIGIASGNLPRIAWHKLELAGIAKYFKNRIGGFGVVLERKDAVVNARKAAEEFNHVNYDIVIHVGDTPSDAIAAQKAGVIPVIVRTGRHYDTYPEPNITFNNLEEGYDDFMKIVAGEKTL